MLPGVVGNGGCVAVGEAKLAVVGDRYARLNFRMGDMVIP